MQGFKVILAEMGQLQPPPMELDPCPPARVGGPRKAGPRGAHWRQSEVQGLDQYKNMSRMDQIPSWNLKLGNQNGKPGNKGRC